MMLVVFISFVQFKPRDTFIGLSPWFSTSFNKKLLLISLTRIFCVLFYQDKSFGHLLTICGFLTNFCLSFELLLV